MYDDAPLYPLGEQEVQLLKQLVTIQRGTVSPSGEVLAPAGASFSIPVFNDQVFTYYGSTNNIQTIEYKNGGSTVATLNFDYVNGGASNNDNVSRIYQS